MQRKREDEIKNRIEVIDISKVKNKALISSDINGNLIQMSPVNPDRLPKFEHERHQLATECNDNQHFKSKFKEFNDEAKNLTSEKLCTYIENNKRFTGMITNITGDGN